MDHNNTATHSDVLILLLLACLLFPPCPGLEQPTIEASTDVSVGDRAHLTCSFTPVQINGRIALSDYSASFYHCPPGRKGNNSAYNADYMRDASVMVQISMDNMQRQTLEINGGTIAVGNIKQFPDHDGKGPPPEVHIKFKTEGLNWAFKLVFVDVSARDYGGYVCSIGLSNQRKDFFSNEIVLNVTGPPFIDTEDKVKLVQAAINSKHVLNVTYYAYPPLQQVVWTLPNGRMYTVGNNSDRPGRNAIDYPIDRLTMDQTGLYECTIINSFGNDTVIFNITGAPFVKVASEFSSNRMQYLECQAINFDLRQPMPDVKFSWHVNTLKGKKNLTSDSSSGIKVSQTVVNVSGVELMKSKVEFDDSPTDLRGDVTCVVEQGYMNREATVRLAITGPPAVTTSQSQIYTSLGVIATLTCNVTSDPPAKQYQWLKDKLKVQKGTSKISPSTNRIKSTMTLQIASVGQDDFGLYRCQAENELGVHGANIMLRPCAKGFKPNTLRDECVDIDECAIQNYPKQHCDYQCVNTNGSFDCACPDGQAVGVNMRSCEDMSAENNDESQIVIITSVLVGLMCFAVLMIVLGVWACRVRRRKKKDKIILKRINDHAQRNRSHHIIKFTNSIFPTDTSKSSPLPNISLPYSTKESSLVNEFPRERLKVGQVVGQGRFGIVCQAEALNIIGTGKWEVVAVKMCKDTATDQDKADFFRELELVSGIPKHLNVVNYLGSCSRTEPVVLIMEYITGGDLQTYLRDNRNFLFHDILSLNEFNGVETEVNDFMAGINDITDPEVWTQSIMGLTFETRDLLVSGDEGEDEDSNDDDDDDEKENEDDEKEDESENDCDDNGDENEKDNDKEKGIVDGQENTGEDCPENHREEKNHKSKGGKRKKKKIAKRKAKKVASTNSKKPLVSTCSSYNDENQSAASTNQAFANTESRRVREKNNVNHNNNNNTQDRNDNSQNNHNQPPSSEEEGYITYAPMSDVTVMTTLESSEGDQSVRDAKQIQKQRPEIKSRTASSAAYSSWSGRRRHNKKGPLTADTVSLADRDSLFESVGRNNDKYGRLSSRSSRFSHMTYSDTSRRMESDIEEEALKSKDLFAFGLQVARGLRHLTEHDIIHRDIAARNVLVTDKGVCKIADFGLARVVKDVDIYERTSKGPLPIRWMAPECLLHGKHGRKSDVWSLGILLWEIVTLGASPYPGMSASDAFKFVTGGRRMEQPMHCRTELYNLMRDCWSYHQDARPSIQVVCNRMEDMLEREADYINMELFESERYVCLETGVIDERL